MRPKNIYQANDFSAIGSISPRSYLYATPDRRAETAKLVPSLPQALTWNHGDGLFDYAKDNQRYFVKSRLTAWSYKSGVPLLDRVACLPLKQQESFLNAPVVSMMLRTGDTPSPEQVDRLTRYLEVEENRDSITVSGKGGWNALGDVFLAGQDAEKPTIRQVRLSPGIVLDTQSEYMRYIWSEDVCGRMQLYSEAESAYVAARVEQSLACIQSNCPVAYNAIKASIAVIGVAKNTPETSIFYSISQKLLPGRMTLGNVHSPEVSGEQIANGIVHEMIHSTIYNLELYYSFYLDWPKALKMTAVSPWSGRTLKLHALMHAFFVWFGLWNFWRAFPTKNAESTRLQAQAEAGFLAGNLSKSLSPEAYNLIVPEMKKSIETMYEMVWAQATNTIGQ